MAKTRATRNCQAILWNTGRPCSRPAASGTSCCPIHRDLLAPLDASAGQYDRQLPEQLGPLSVAQELQLARLQLRALLARRAEPADVLSALTTIAALARLQHQLACFPA